MSLSQVEKERVEAFCRDKLGLGPYSDEAIDLLRLVEDIACGESAAAVVTRHFADEE